MTGSSISKSVRQFRACSDRKIAAIVKQILKALEYLHKEGFVHRGLRSDSVLLEKELHQCTYDDVKVKLTDFGLATKVGMGLTLFCGVDTHMAPEMIRLT
jgi:serine/threonine protein kinase